MIEKTPERNLNIPENVLTFSFADDSSIFNEPGGADNCPCESSIETEIISHKDLTFSTTFNTHYRCSKLKNCNFKFNDSSKTSMAVENSIDFRSSNWCKFLQKKQFCQNEILPIEAAQLLCQFQNIGKTFLLCIEQFCDSTLMIDGMRVLTLHNQRGEARDAALTPKC